MKKKPLILEELIIWLRGRFTMTDEEKIWMLLVLVICWAGLVCRYFYLKYPLSPVKRTMDRGDFVQKEPR